MLRHSPVMLLQSRGWRRGPRSECGDSLRVAAAAAEQYGVELQMRTTLWPGSVIEQHLEELQGEVAKLGHELHLQWARNVDGAGRYVA